MEQRKVILVEDDSIIAELLEFNLRSEGYETFAFKEGAALFRALSQLPEPDLFILDLMLPGMDGFAICKRLRQDPRFELTPILMLTARSAESDKVSGLDSGADDYLTKPFGIRELLARVNALIRRFRRSTSAGSAGSAGSASSAGSAKVDLTGKIASGEIMLDDVRHRVFKNGNEIEMTNREFELLKYLMSNRGIAFSRDELLDRVWGYEYGGETRTVDVHIRQLRRKIETDDANPILIETVRGRGYRWTDQV